MVLPRHWKPVPSDGLTIVGPKSDGGYIASEDAIAATDVLISMGLYDDWRFEQDFHNRTGANVVVFDHTVTWPFWISYTLRALIRGRFHQLGRAVGYRKFFRNPDIAHRRVRIGDGTAGSIDLNSIIADLPKKAKLFLKMDIEGGEYEILDQIAQHCGRFAGMAIEVHDLDRRREAVEQFMQALDGFVVVGLHPNNHHPPDYEGDPVLLEISLAHQDYVKPNIAAQVPHLPPTMDDRPDIPLKFA